MRLYALLFFSLLIAGALAIVVGSGDLADPELRPAAPGPPAGPVASAPSAVRQPYSQLRSRILAILTEAQSAARDDAP